MADLSRGFATAANTGAMTDVRTAAAKPTAMPVATLPSRKSSMPAMDASLRRRCPRTMARDDVIRKSVARGQDAAVDAVGSGLRLHVRHVIDRVAQRVREARATALPTGMLQGWTRFNVHPTDGAIVDPAWLDKALRAARCAFTRSR